MAYDVLIKNGRIVDGSGMPSFHGDVAVKDGKIAEIGKLSGAAGQTRRCRRPGRRARLYRQPLPLRRAGHLGPALLVLLRPRRDHVVIGNCSLSLAPVRSGNATRMAEFLVLCRSDPDGGAQHHRGRLGDLPAIHGPARPQSRRQCRHADRPHRGALLRDGRGVPDAHRHRRRTEGDAGRRARQHGRRRARPVGVAQQGPLRPAGRAHPGAVGRREGDFRARRRVARDGHRHHPVGRRPRRRDDGRADGAPLGSHRPAGRLQQSRPERAPPRRVAEAHGAGQRDRGTGHPRLSAVLAEHDDADLQHEQHAGVPRLADLAPDPARLG